MNKKVQENVNHKKTVATVLIQEGKKDFWKNPQWTRRKGRNLTKKI
jgi:hypothetical protein